MYIFYKCFAQRGGIFYIISEISPTIQINNCNFTNIIAVQEGGAFFFSLAANSILNFKTFNCNFQNILALMSDGGVFHLVSYNFPYIEIVNCNFSHLHSGLKGALIYSFLTTFNLTNSYFFDNAMLDEDILAYFQLIGDSAYKISNFIEITQCIIEINFCNFSNIQIDTDEYLFGVYDCEFYDFNSVFENLLFQSQFFYIATSSLNFDGTHFFNTSALENDKSLSFFSVYDSSINFSRCLVKNSWCSSCQSSSFQTEPSFFAR